MPFRARMAPSFSMRRARPRGPPSSSPAGVRNARDGPQSGQESVWAWSRRSPVSAYSLLHSAQGGNSSMALVARSNGTSRAMVKRGPQAVQVLKG
jgi:hypothetical protein